MNRIKVRKIKDIEKLTDLCESEVREGKTDEWETAVIVFKHENFTKEYSEESRSYLVHPDNKFFKANMLGSGLYGSCLDGTDPCLRLNNSYYPYWSVEKVYTCEVIKDEKEA